MKVTIEDHLGGQWTLELSEALRPDGRCQSGGQLEQIAAQAQANSKAIGNLAELLVRRGLLTVTEALKACDDWVVLLKVEE
jgi:hypothetical protein